MIMNRRQLADLASAPALIVAVVGACSSSTPPAQQSDAAKQITAGATYTADVALCVDKEKYASREQSDACIASVNLRWHRLPDGGADGAYTDGGVK